MMLYFVLYSLGLLKKSLTISGCFRLWYLYAIFVNTTSKPKDKLVDFPFWKILLFILTISVILYFLSM